MGSWPVRAGGAKAFETLCREEDRELLVGRGGSRGRLWVQVPGTLALSPQNSASYKACARTAASPASLQRRPASREQQP